MFVKNQKVSNKKYAKSAIWANSYFGSTKD